MTYQEMPLNELIFQQQQLKEMIKTNQSYLYKVEDEIKRRYETGELKKVEE